MLFLGREGVISARLYNGVRKEMANNMAHIDNMQQRERGGKTKIGTLTLTPHPDLAQE